MAAGLGGDRAANIEGAECLIVQASCGVQVKDGNRCSLRYFYVGVDLHLVVSVHAWSRSTTSVGGCSFEKCDTTDVRACACDSPERRRLAGLRGIRIGEAAHPGPGGSRTTKRKREQRHGGYAGQRIGEAANPGRATDGQLSMLIQLVQLLLQMVAQLSGGNADMSGLITQANTAMNGLMQGGGDSQPRTPARRVTIAEPVEEPWQEVVRRKGKGKSDKSGGGTSTPEPPGKGSSPTTSSPARPAKGGTEGSQARRSR